MAVDVGGGQNLCEAKEEAAVEGFVRRVWEADGLEETQVPVQLCDWVPGLAALLGEGGAVCAERDGFFADADLGLHAYCLVEHVAADGDAGAVGEDGKRLEPGGDLVAEDGAAGDVLAAVAADDAWTAFGAEAVAGGDGGEPGFGVGEHGLEAFV